jgi:cytochrome c553
VAVAFDGRDRVVVQTRAPSRIVVIDGPVMSIGDEVRRDTGQEVFHAMTDSFLACASCHPEGGDDGRVWAFDRIGRRRTPPVRGGIMDTAPFHWDGDMRSFAHLTSEVFTGRMAGNQLTPEQSRALEHWIDRVPAIPVARPADTASVARGEALFRSDEVVHQQPDGRGGHRGGVPGADAGGARVAGSADARRMRDDVARSLHQHALRRR